MIKKITYLVLIMFFQVHFAQDIVQERKKIGKMLQSKSFTTQYLKELEQKDSTQPMMKGMKGMAHFFMSKHAFNPLTKLEHFKKGKKILENAIREAPKNIELRFFRLQIQENVPKILNYNENIESDRAFIDRNLDRITDQALKKIIIQYKKQNS